MADGTIEILGQKLSYPTTWHGTAAVIAVCFALVAILFILKGWATPEIMDKITAGAKQYSDSQREVNERIAGTNANMEKRITALENKITKESPPGAEVSLNSIRESQLKSQLDLSKLQEKLADQNIIRSQVFSPIVNPGENFNNEIKEYQQQKTQQQLIQKNLTSRLEKLQSTEK